MPLAFLRTSLWNFSGKTSWESSRNHSGRTLENIRKNYCKIVGISPKGFRKNSEEISSRIPEVSFKKYFRKYSTANFEMSSKKKSESISEGIRQNIWRTLVGVLEDFLKDSRKHKRNPENSPIKFRKYPRGIVSRIPERFPKTFSNSFRNNLRWTFFKNHRGISGSALGEYSK